MISTEKMLTEAFKDKRKTAKLRIIFNGDQIVERDNLLSAKFTENLADNNITIGSAFSQSFELTMRMPEDAVPLTGAYFAAEVAFDTEWVPLGTFYVSAVSTNDDYKTVSVTATDRMALLADSYTPGISLPATQRAVIADIASQYSLTLDSIDYADATITQLYEGTVRDYLGWLAGLSGANARFDRNGKLTFTWYKQIVARFGDANLDEEINSADVSYINTNLLGSASTKEAEAILGRMIAGSAYIGAQIVDSERGPVADVNEDGIIDSRDTAEIQAYINGSPYNPTTVGTIRGYRQSLDKEQVEKKGFSLTAAETCTISALISGTEESPVESGSGKAINFYNPFMDKNTLDAIAGRILPFTYLAAEVTYRGCPSWEVGDIVRVRVNGDWDVPIMNQTMEFGTKLSAEAKSYGLSDEEASTLAAIPDIKTVQRQLPGIRQMITDINESLLSGDTGYMILDETEIDGVKRLSGFRLMDTPTITDTTKGWLANKNGIGWSSNGFKTISKLGLDMANGKIYADQIAAGAVITNSFKIGRSDTEYAMSFDGATGEIKFGAGVTISWSNVNNKPDNLATTDDIPTSTSELTNDSGFAYTSDIPDMSNYIRKYGTYITDTAVWTGSLTANDLTITGGTINISTGETIKNIIKLAYTGGNAQLSPRSLEFVADDTSAGDTYNPWIKLDTRGWTTNIYPSGMTVTYGNWTTKISPYGITVAGESVLTTGDLSGYAKTGHTHSGSDISGGYPSVESVYLTNPGTASSVAIYRSTNSGILGIPSSSRRYKNSIGDVTTESLNPERLYELPVRQFKWNEGHFGNEENYDYSTINIGFIAEEVADIYPFAAVVMDGKIETWEARNLLPPILALIQEQHKEIEELKKKVEALS